MRIQFLLALLLLNVSMARPLLAANLALYLVDKKLSVKVANIQYPKAILMREMKSGLPNVLDMMVRLTGSDGLETSDQVRYIITYDLWDEHYLVTAFKLDSQQRKTIETDANLLHWLSSVRLNGLDTEQVLRNKGELKLSFQTFFNPVQSDRINKIQNWIRTSKGYDVSVKDASDDAITSTQAASKHANLASKHTNLASASNHTSGRRAPVSSGPRFQKLFDKILEDHMNQDAVAAQWKSERLIKTFTLESLLREKR